MCGIAGFVLAQPSLPRAEIEARLWAMTGTIKHRGPDDQAVSINLPQPESECRAARNQETKPFGLR